MLTENNCFVCCILEWRLQFNQPLAVGWRWDQFTNGVRISNTYRRVRILKHSKPSFYASISHLCRYTTPFESIVWATGSLLPAIHLLESFHQIPCNHRHPSPVRVACIHSYLREIVTYCPSIFSQVDVDWSIGCHGKFVISLWYYSTILIYTRFPPLLHVAILHHASKIVLNVCRSCCTRQ